jgi:ketosteroid isomerase-like protein
MLVSSPRTGEYLPAMKEGGVSAWRPIFDAFESRDDERIVAHCDPEIEWHTLWPGMERVFRGWAGVTRWRAAIDEALAGLSLQMEEAIQLGPDLFFLAYRLSARGRQSGVASQMEIYDLWKLRDGKLLCRRTFRDRHGALAAAGELAD